MQIIKLLVSVALMVGTAMAIAEPEVVRLADLEERDDLTSAPPNSPSGAGSRGFIATDEL